MVQCFEANTVTTGIGAWVKRWPRSPLLHLETVHVRSGWAENLRGEDVIRILPQVIARRNWLQVCSLLFEMNCEPVVRECVQHVPNLCILA